MFKINYSKQAARFFSKQSEKEKKRIRAKLNVLCKNPFGKNLDIKKIKDKIYRLRIGEIRVVYELNTKGKTIQILLMDDRGDVYKKMRYLLTLLLLME